MASAIPILPLRSANCDGISCTSNILRILSLSLSLLLFTTIQMTKPTIAPTKAIPPTAIPAIAPVESVKLVDALVELH